MTNPWSFNPERPIDVICMGRVAVDLYSEQIGCSIEESQTFRKYLGGCAGNIAVGSARLGLRSAMLSCVGKDAMGQFVKQTLKNENVDISLLAETKNHLTALVILGIMPPDRFPLIFYRQNCADMQLKGEHIDKVSITNAKALLITGTGLSTKPMCDTTHHVVDMANIAKTYVIFDLDYRPVLWGLTEQGDGESRYKFSNKVSEQYQRILPKCDLLVGTEEEICIAGGEDTVDKALQALRLLTPAPIVLKRGTKGCCIYLDNLKAPITASAFAVKVLNVLGAGDAFLSGFMRGLLRGESLETCAVYANACGAIVVTRHGCAPAMPSFTEMMQFIADYQTSERNTDVRFSYS